jgi:hypothetical protein
MVTNPWRTIHVGSTEKWMAAPDASVEYTVLVGISGQKTGSAAGIA